VLEFWLWLVLWFVGVDTLLGHEATSFVSSLRSVSVGWLPVWWLVCGGGVVV